MRLLRSLAAVAVAALLTTACGGGDQAPTAGAAPSDVAASEPEAGETPPPTPSDPPTSPPVDDDAAALAEAAVLRLKDLGRDYQQYAEASGAAPYEAAACDPPIQSTTVAQFGGATIKHKTEPLYFLSSSAVFPSKQEAADYIRARNDDEWVECRRAELDELQKEQAGKRYAVEVGRRNPGTGTAEDAYAQFIITFKGEPSGAHILRYAFQFGRVVVNVGWEQQGDGERGSLTDVAGDDLERAIDAAGRRIKASD